MTGPLRFRFLDREHELRAAGDWSCADWPRLWRYNLHYFDDLVADEAAARGAWHGKLLERWVAENPPGCGVGWDPYPTSLRIVNWVKWAWSGNQLTEAARASLAAQARWLRRRCEVHLLGNHLWVNAKALAFAGAYFEGPEADAWRGQGLALLRRELTEQVLPDGGHFERSPMYHALVLEDLLDLVQLAQLAPGTIPVPDLSRWRDTAAHMHRWLRVMSHPDGGIAQFNDAALDAAPTAAALAAYATALGVPLNGAPLADLEALPQSGYVRLQRNSAILIADVGEIGPDYQPGHAHADTLSFELALAGQRVLVNGGTSTYEVGDERARERGTAAHNTVVVDGVDSSEVWSSFRVARRARPLAVRWGRSEDGVPWLEGAHDGYRRLPGRVIHWRRWAFSADGLVVQDRLEGRWHEAEVNFRFGPGWQVDPVAGRASGPAGAALRLGVEGARATQVRTTTCGVRFGTPVECSLLWLSFAGPVVTTTFRWD